MTEHETATLEVLCARAKEAKELSSDPEQEAKFRSLIEEMGTVARNERKKQDTEQKIREEERQEREPYNPTPYFLFISSVMAECSFGEGKSSSVVDLTARLDRIDFAIKHLTKLTELTA